MFSLRGGGEQQQPKWGSPACTQLHIKSFPKLWLSIDVEPAQSIGWHDIQRPIPGRRSGWKWASRSHTVSSLMESTVQMMLPSP